MSPRTLSKPEWQRRLDIITAHITKLRGALKESLDQAAINRTRKEIHRLTTLANRLKRGKKPRSNSSAPA